jgi:rhodanese-related sulfurtransferase
MFRSLTEILFHLPDETVVWPGHDYQGRSNSTIGAEKAGNARVAGKTLAEFKAIMEELNLPKPTRLDEAVPANRYSGVRHDAGGGPSVPRTAVGYAGNVEPQVAWEWWQKGDAILVDVRTDAEREWVGFVPGAVPLPWKQWPGMKLNEEFDEGIKAAVPPGKKAVLFCRSGVRSMHAARRATELGIEAYNILEGFEGDPDESGQRGKRVGWRFRGLPWRQG